MPRKLLHALLKLPESEASGLILIQPCIDIVDLARQIVRVLERHQTLCQLTKKRDQTKQTVSLQNKLHHTLCQRTKKQTLVSCVLLLTYREHIYYVSKRTHSICE